MAETDFIPIKAARFRTSRYPGFVGGSIDPVTGNLRPGFPTLTPNAGETTDATAEEEKPTARFRGLRRFVNNPVTEHEEGDSVRLKTKPATPEQAYLTGQFLKSPRGRATRIGLAAIPGVGPIASTIATGAATVPSLYPQYRTYKQARKAGVGPDNADSIAYGPLGPGPFRSPDGRLNFTERAETAPGFTPDPNESRFAPGAVTSEPLAPPRGLHAITRNPVEPSRGIFSEAARNEADSGGYDERAGGGSRSREDIDEPYGDPFNF